MMSNPIQMIFSLQNTEASTSIANGTQIDIGILLRTKNTTLIIIFYKHGFVFEIVVVLTNVYGLQDRKRVVTHLSYTHNINQ